MGLLTDVVYPYNFLLIIGLIITERSASNSLTDLVMYRFGRALRWDDGDGSLWPATAGFQCYVFEKGRKSLWPEIEATGATTHPLIMSLP